MNDLVVVKVDRARQLLAEARDAQGAKHVVDLAKAAEVYARRQKLSEEAIAYAREVKVDAMTLLGEMLKKTPKNTGAKGIGKSVLPKEKDTPTLGDHGISWKESSDAQTLADLKTKAPQAHEQVRSGKKTVSQAKQEIKRQRKREELAAAAAGGTTSGGRWQVLHGDAIEQLAKLKAGSADLIFADPPYNIGIDYGDGANADRLGDAEYLSWCEQWVNECITALSPTGTFWLLVGDEYAADFAQMLWQGLHRRAWVIWYETFGVCNSSGNNFSRTHRHLFYCVKNPRQFTWNPGAVTRPSDRQAKYNDARASPGGKVWDDVWAIPRLTGTCTERVPDFPTQLPLDLLTPIVLCSSNPGDLVVDPFSGSGTTGVAAIRHGRRYVGVEKRLKFAELSVLRLKGEANGPAGDFEQSA